MQEQELIVNEADEIVMKLLHFFITEEGYNPIILRGVNNEIWLENLQSEYKVVRIVSNYIHNDEQLKYDILKTKHIVNKIKQKTFSFRLPTLSLFVNMGENVTKMKSGNNVFDHVSCVKIDSMNDIKKNKFLNTVFPLISQDMNFKEKGMALFVKLTNDINKKNITEAKKADDVFQKKTPTITYILMAINVLFFLGARFFPNFLENFFLVNAANMQGQWYRILTSAFLHYGFFHFLCNMYALYVIGPQIESFLGKGKYIFVYLISAITGNLFSMMFMGNNQASLGASGAIFGLLGSLLYFGYHYRVYLGNILKSQIIPLILLNLLLGMVVSGVDNFAHIGGLIGGVLATIAVGVKYKSTKFEEVNGFVALLIFLGFLIFTAFRGF